MLSLHASLLTGRLVPDEALEMWNARRDLKRRIAGLRRQLGAHFHHRLGHCHRPDEFTHYVATGPVSFDCAFRLMRPFTIFAGTPDAIVRNNKVTIRLSPKDRALAAEACGTIAVERVHIGYDFSQMLAFWLEIHASVFAQRELEEYRRRWPNPLRLPPWNHQLETVVVPNPNHRRPPYPKDFPTHENLPARWDEYKAALQEQRLSTREFHRRFPELGGLLDQKHRELSRPGRKGGFHAWLRQFDFPRQTAYRIMGLWKKLNKTADLSCTKVAKTMPPPDLEFRANAIVLRVEPQVAAVFHRVFQDVNNKKRPTDLSGCVAMCYLQHLFRGPARDQAFEAWKLDPKHFRPPRIDDPPVRFWNRKPPVPENLWRVHPELAAYMEARRSPVPE